MHVQYILRGFGSFRFIEALISLFCLEFTVVLAQRHHACHMPHVPNGSVDRDRVIQREGEKEKEQRKEQQRRGIEKKQERERE